MLFFDIDNTLLDSDTAESSAAMAVYNQNKLLQDLYPEEEFLGIWKETAAKFLQKYLEGQLTFEQQSQAVIKDVFKTPLGERESEAILKDYLAACAEHWQLYYDVLPMLEKYKDVSKGIISNGDGDLQRHKLQKTGIDGFFNIVVISEDIGIAKPDPGIFLHAVKQAGMEPSKCWYIGDKISIGAKAAMDAGLTGIWLNRKLAGKDEKVPEIISFTDLIYSAS